MSDLKNTDHMASQYELESNVRFVMLNSAQQDDEISLIDLWLVLAKRKILLFTVMLVFTAAGLIFSFSMPKQYNYSTAIEIGAMSYGTSGQPVYIEKPSSLLAKIKQSYIPLMAKEYLVLHPEFEKMPDIKVKLEKNSNIIFIDLKGQEDYADVYIELLNSLILKIKQDHQRVSLLKRKDLELSENQFKNEIMMLKEQEGLLVSQNKRLDTKKVLLENRIKETGDFVKASTKIKRKAMREVGTEGQAISLMMVDAEIRKNRNTLARLEEQLQITLENTREINSNKLTENHRKQLQTNEELERLVIQQNNLLETRAITEPLQSLKSVGMGRIIIVVVSFFAGLCIALFVGFFAEFLEKVKKQATTA
ncbi:MAG: hypothetical protein DIZ80_13905 [endosymbiont of Galathealinum brachiosum]|uniref:Polysaccharide chain length determinant N-terminal domain-containing protein n=1 Tax=endosymbiont of Galathealinum brachiosum TaxID=2200906 RepID=A0A370D8H5_9GAMM|nr:MAG: hypothetical protein DIZ80_13905 [endosymbiont of Galathealinum brachiosum]